MKGGEWAFADQARWLGRAASDSHPVYRTLVALASHGNSGVGRFSHKLAGGLVSSVLGTSHDSFKFVLPIAAEAAQMAFSHWVLSQPVGLRDGIVEASIGLILALNFYACVGFSSKPFEAKPIATLAEAKLRTCRHLFGQFRNYLEAPPPKFEHDFDLLTEFYVTANEHPKMKQSPPRTCTQMKAARFASRRCCDSRRLGPERVSRKGILRSTTTQNSLRF